jgi:hypothetical protein
MHGGALPLLLIYCYKKDGVGEGFCFPSHMHSLPLLQVLVDCIDGQPATGIYRGRAPSWEECCTAAGIPTGPWDGALVNKWLPDATWAFLPKGELEASLQPITDAAKCGDATILGGPVPHSGACWRVPTHAVTVCFCCSAPACQDYCM